MRITAITEQTRLYLRRLQRSGDGVSAVEFALILPLMLTLYIGGVEAGNGVTIQFKSMLAARTVADLASRYTNIDTPTMSSILNSAFIVVTPYSNAKMTATVSEVSTDANGSAKITWSCSLNGAGHTFGSSVALPNSVNAPNISIIWGEVSYPYLPQLGYVLTGTINIYQQIFFYPRLAATVSGPATAGACPAS